MRPVSHSLESGFWTSATLLQAFEQSRSPGVFPIRVIRFRLVLEPLLD